MCDYLLQVELAGFLASQRQALEEEYVAALGVLQQEVLALEHQHSTTFQELRQQAEVQAPRAQQQLQWLQILS